MNKYLALGLLILLINSFTLSAQQFELQEGVPSETKSDPLKIIDLYQGNLVSISKNKDQYYLVKYDKENLGVIDYKELSIKYHNKKADFVDFIKINDSYYLISRFINKKTHKSFYLQQKYSLATLEPVGKIEVWSRSFHAKIDRNTDFFLVRESPNQSKILVINAMESLENNSTKLQIRLYDIDSMMLWQKHLKLPIDLNLFKLYDTKIDNNGQVYILGKKYFNDYRDVKNSKINYEFIIFRYNYLSDKLYQYHFDTKQKVVIQMQFALNAQQEIICGAITYDKTNKERVNAETYILNSKSEQFVMQDQRNIAVYNLAAKMRPKDKNYIPTFASQGMKNLDNGKFLFLCEQRDFLMQNGTSIPPSYFFGYMQSLSILIDSNGLIIEDFEVMKLQGITEKKTNVVAWDEYLDPISSGAFSYIFVASDHGFYIIYNEFTKNVKNKSHKIYHGEEDKALPLACFIKENQKNQCFPISTSPNTKLRLYTNAYFQVGNELYVIANRNGGQLVLKISFL